jgi:hypothetical protein
LQRPARSHHPLLMYTDETKTSPKLIHHLFLLMPACMHEVHSLVYLCRFWAFNAHTSTHTHKQRTQKTGICLLQDCDADKCTHACKHDCCLQIKVAMQRQILPSGRYMPHLSGRSVRRLLRSTTHELGRQTESRHVVRKAFSLALLGITRIGASWALCLELVPKMQDLFEFLMHAYVNKHEVAESARRCIHVCVVSIMTFTAYMHVYVCVCASAHAYTYRWMHHACICMQTLICTS